ncbi:Thymidylate synthase [Strongyloides ratti]|uniref:Thymidylate synthase n=1 Tax=Strongyloides ratti TaxID=34506 RepID=A0A090LIW5_STRRB|nr:Thymidylate synthase [Strongyloides ratti]CEF69732.1 Thymidylate synthase [Strongyloides ratti]
MVRINKDEIQYLDLIRNILENGKSRDDRTGTGTISVFGTQSRYSLKNGTMPLITTKKTFWKGIVEELLWFISGSTNAKELSARGVKIWEANGSREFLDNLGFTERQEGDLGPVYGFQWRHFGATYKGVDADYRGEGIDQLAQVIDQIKTNPFSRRIILSAWNPSDLDKMVLPPCHTLAQFYVQDGELSCHLYQRSGDVGLGVPFNIASYSLLTHMIAKVCGIATGEFVHTIGDAHIYKNHIDALKLQLTREPYQFPTIKFVGDGLNTIDDFTSKNIVLENYEFHPPIKMDMAV